MATKLMPNFEHHKDTLRSVCLAAFHRIDPFIVEILGNATHVGFYDFDVKSRRWSRKNFVGPLFVVKRIRHPRFQFIVMNRNSAENLVENILGDFDFEVQPPYIFYRNEANQVNGLWFNDNSECREVGRLFKRITNAYTRVPAKLKELVAKSEMVDVPSLLVNEGLSEPPASTASTADVSNNSSVKADIAAVKDSSLDSASSAKPLSASAIVSEASATSSELSRLTEHHTSTESTSDFSDNSSVKSVTAAVKDDTSLDPASSGQLLSASATIPEPSHVCEPPISSSSTYDVSDYSSAKCVTAAVKGDNSLDPAKSGQPLSASAAILQCSLVCEGPSKTSASDVSDKSSMKYVPDSVKDVATIDPAGSGQPLNASTAIPEPSHGTSATAAAVPTAGYVSSVTSSILAVDAGEPECETCKTIANLLKHSSFTPSRPSSTLVTPSLSSEPSVPPSYPPVAMQTPHDTPPLIPSVSLTPSSTNITKDKVHDALQRLVKNDDFIEMVYLEMLKTYS